MTPINFNALENKPTDKTQFFKVVLNVGSDLSLEQLHEEIKNVVVGLLRKDAIAVIGQVETGEIA